MTEAGRDRPRRLVTACLYLGLISGLQVIGVFVELADWNSLDGQARLKRWTAPMVDGGMARADAETVLRVAFTIVAIIAAAGVVFAVYTALGHAVSRIMLTIVGPIIGAYCVGQGSLVLAIQGVVAFTCVFQLWSSDVRTWFAVKNGTALPGAGKNGAGKNGAGQPVAAAAGTWPPPLTPSAQPGPDPSDPQPQLPYAGHPDPQPRQDVVKVWSLIVLILSSLVALGSGAYLVAYQVARDEMVRQQVESSANWMNLSETEIRDAYEQLAMLSWIALPLCLVAIGASVVLLLRRRRQQ